MKKHVLSLALGLTAAAVVFTGCNKPTQRDSVMDKEIAGKVMELSALKEITSASAEAPKTVLYAGSEKNLSALNSEAVTLSQIKLEGDIEKITKKVTTPTKAAAIAEQLKEGVIAIVILESEVKILKVTPEVTNNNPDYVVSSLQLFDAMKAMSRTSNPQMQAELVQKMDQVKFQSPAQLGEKFGLVELAAVKVEKYGVLEDKKTEYGERMSIQTLTQVPFELSTHIILGAEVGAPAEESAEGGAAAAE